MSRVTPTEVIALVATKLSDTIVQVWINAANTIVTENQDCISASKLTQVELYLSAHFVAMLDPSKRGAVTSEAIPDFKTTYASSVAMSKELINSTVWGQTANMLSGGCLASVSKEAISFGSLGGRDDTCFD